MRDGPVTLASSASDAAGNSHPRDCLAGPQGAVTGSSPEHEHVDQGASDSELRLEFELIYSAAPVPLELDSGNF